MDLISVSIWFFSVFTGAFVASFICTLVITGYGVAQLEKRIKSLEMGNLSARGVIAREELAEQEGTVMLQAAAIIKNPDLEQKDKMQQLISLGMQNPKIASKIIKQFGLKDLL